MKCFFVLALLFFFVQAPAQKTDAGLNPLQPYYKSIVIGGNYTYIFDSEIPSGAGYKSSYKEHTLAANIAFDFSKHFRAGLDYKKIFTNGVISGKNQYAVYGAFTQYKFFNNPKRFFFGELGFYKGNYCTCGQGSPYKKENLSYLSFGAGYNVRLYNNLRLDLAFTNAQVVSKVVQPYAYTQYIIGLDYVLPFKAGVK